MSRAICNHASAATSSASWPTRARRYRSSRGCVSVYSAANACSSPRTAAWTRAVTSSGWLATRPPTITVVGAPVGRALRAQRGRPRGRDSGPASVGRIAADFRHTGSVVLEFAPTTGPVHGGDLAEHRLQRALVDRLALADGHRAGGLVVVAAGDDALRVGDHRAVVQKDVHMVLRGQQGTDVALQDEV